MIANLLNPKAFLFYVAVAPHFLGGRIPSAAQMAVLAVISIGIATAVHIALVAFAGHAHGWVADNNRTRLVRRALALVMVGVAAWFVFELRR